MNPTSMNPTYRYRAVLAKMTDGDGFWAMVDQGFNDFTKIRVRLRGVNATERYDPGGPEATAFLANLITGRPLLIESYKDQMSFERWICDVWVAGDDGAPRRVADAIIAAGHGVEDLR